MRRLPALTPRDVVRILRKKGFAMERSKGSHQVFVNSETNRTVVVPFHKKDLPRCTFFEILRQAGIDREEIEQLL
ncbi:MAG: type II toxin-antitoxin system HicA family toxin [Planctomycetota bacterium]|nr:type II toxin-antitoxin system HicA family toxin [Planctomycetota bacterium]